MDLDFLIICKACGGSNVILVRGGWEMREEVKAICKDCTNEEWLTIQEDED